MTDTYDDDRPGMMRVHVAQARADALCARYSFADLRRMARERGIKPWEGSKKGYAFDLALAGVAA